MKKRPRRKPLKIIRVLKGDPVPKTVEEMIEIFKNLTITIEI